MGAAVQWHGGRGGAAVTATDTSDDLLVRLLADGWHVLMDAERGWVLIGLTRESCVESTGYCDPRCSAANLHDALLAACIAVGVVPS